MHGLHDGMCISLPASAMSQVRRRLGAGMWPRSRVRRCVDCRLAALARSGSGIRSWSRAASRLPDTLTPAANLPQLGTFSGEIRSRRRVGFTGKGDSEESEDRNSSKILTITTVEKKKENKKEERKNGNTLF